VGVDAEKERERGGRENGLLLTWVLQGWEVLPRRVDETLHVGSRELDIIGILDWDLVST